MSTSNPQERLRELLQEMETLLPELDVDPATRALAEDAKQDLARIVERDDPALQGEDEGVLEKLEDAELAFEATYPTFSGVMRRLIDVLGQMGI
jgi:hypothetical protein